MTDHNNPEGVCGFEDHYLNILENILDHGYVKGDRTGTGTLSTFGQFMRIDLRGGKLPLLTTKRMFYRSFIHETLWFTRGETDIAYLKENGVGIWDSWVDPKTARYADLTDKERRSALVKAGVFENLTDVPDAEYIQESLMAVHELPLKKLIGGSIGSGAYGAMWRNMEDTRLVDLKEDFQDYEKKGFNFKGIVGGVKHDSEGMVIEDTRKVVVTRRIDQLSEMIRKLREDPDNRRNITHLYDSRMVDFCRLAPCHSLHMCWTRELSVNERFKIARQQKIEIENIPVWGDRGEHNLLDAYGVPQRALRLMLWQRSADHPVGVPFNIAQYALFAHMLAHVTNMVAEELIWAGADVHVYSNQAILAEEQLDRTPFANTATVRFTRPITNFDDFKFEDIIIEGYDDYHPEIKYPVAV